MSERRPARNDSFQMAHSDFSRSLFGSNGRAFLNGEARPLTNKLANWQLVVTALLLVLLYGAVPLEFSLSLNAYYVLCTIGLFVAFRESGMMPLSENEKTGLMIVLVFCLVSIFTFWINGMPGKGSQYVQGRHGKFLLAIPLYFFFRHYLIPNVIIWMLAVFVAVELLCIAILDQATTDIFAWPGRASGNTHPIYFGIQSLLMVALILAFRDEWSEKKIPRLLARVGVLAAFTALILTGSRSVWLAVPVIGILYLVSRVEQFKISYGLKVAVMVLVSSVLLYQLPFVKDRWNEAIDEFHEYQISESVDDPARVSSLGARLEMWRAARLMILDNPILGVGTGGFQTTATRYYEQGGWSIDITQRNGPHNQYLNSWASRGIVGLGVGILILLAPFVYCLRVRKESPFEDVRQLALACMMVVIIFAVSGMSDDSLEKKPLIILYLTTVTLLLGQIRHRSRI